MGRERIVSRRWQVERSSFVPSDKVIGVDEFVKACMGHGNLYLCASPPSDVLVCVVPACWCCKVSCLPGPCFLPVAIVGILLSIWVSVSSSDKTTNIIMQLPPPAVLAKFPRPNYVNPETKGASLLITNVVMLSVSLVVVGIRIYTRLFISRNFGWDDFFILLAFVSRSSDSIYHIHPTDYHERLGFWQSQLWQE